MNSLVSILIPVYNSQEWLAQTIQSALDQTWQNKEIIIVDDGSKDNSLAIANSFASSITKVIARENRGASAARNCALQAAQGDFIQYLDADDLLAPNKIECQIERLEKGNLECVTSGTWGRFYNSSQEANFIPEPVWRDMSPVDWLICSWEGGGMMHPAAWLVPRAIAQLAGNWNEKLSLNDDGEYFCRTILASKGIEFCPEAKSYYRSGITGSLSGKRSKTGWESAFLSLELCVDRLLSREDTPRTRHASATAFQRFIYSTYPEAIDIVQKAEAKVASLGGSSLKPDGGLVFQILARTIGWKLAKRVQGSRGDTWLQSRLD
jgi:glycosyltransferase involved in cell wall biosynthesis